MRLQTERLVLRPFTFDDIDFIIRLLNTDGWLKYIGDRNVKTPADAERYLLNGPLKSYAENGFGLSAVEISDSGELIGMCGLIKRDGLEHVDLGFAFLPEYNGKGYASEIGNTCLRHAFHELRLEKVVAITLPENQASIGVLQKIGMQFQQSLTLPGETEILQLFSTIQRSEERPPFIDFPVLSDDKILLREIAMEEAENVLEIISYNQQLAKNLTEAEKKLLLIDFNYRSGTGINWGIFDKISQELIGTIGYYRGFKDEMGEIGFVTRERFRRQGYTQRAVQLLVAFGLGTMKLKQIKAFTKPDNEASQNLLIKCSFHKTGKIEEGYMEFEYRA